MTTQLKTVTLRLGHPATNGVARITLNRPRKKNAIDHQMYRDIGTALKEAGTNDATKAIVLTGAGDYYSAGNDLANFAQLMHPKTMAARAKVVCYGFVDNFIECPKPIVAAANGPAIGIPVTTMGLCDKRFAVAAATFHTPFRALGQAPEGCSSFTFPRLMGPEMAKQVLDAGHKFDAAEAKRMGFLDDVFPDVETLLRHADATAADLGAKGGRWFDGEPGLKHQLKRVNAAEVDVLEEAWVSEECFDALSKYLASRNQRVPATVLKALNMTRRIWAG
jgi:peroxisomal 3,2-trans-enoyl-CoA isomerase